MYIFTTMVRVMIFGALTIGLGASMPNYAADNPEEQSGTPISGLSGGPAPNSAGYNLTDYDRKMAGSSGGGSTRQTLARNRP